MDKDTLLRSGAVLGSSYIKRWLEPRYDQLLELPFMARVRTSSLGSKYAIEAILYSLTAFAEQRMADSSPLGLMVKSLLMDAAPEISARLLKDARSDLSEAATGGRQPEQNVASKLLALDDAALLGLLVSLEDMDAATRARFLAFASKASDDELRHFASLEPDQRSALLGLHSDRQAASDAGASFKSFLQDFWAVVKAGGQRTAEVSLPVLSRYLAALVEVFKASGTLLLVALVVCTASTLMGRWSLFAVVLGLLAASGGLAYVGKGMQKKWLSAAGVVSGAVMALLALLVAAGYPDAVFAVAVLFLVGLPTLAIVALLIPATTIGEILQRMFPDGHRTLVRAFQMLVAAFFGVILFSLVLLLFPPQNPVAFLFIVPAVLVTVVAVGFGLARIDPESFFRTPVILSLGAVMLVAMGVMSMPNLRQTMRRLPAKLDLTLVDAPVPVTFVSSADIDFVDMKDGEAKIWYAERVGGGYDLFRCEGVGPYYAKDGRRLTKADDENTRLKIAASVDREAAARAEASRRADSEAARARAEGQERAAREEAAAGQRLEEQQRAARAEADKERRSGYLNVKSLPGRVDFIVCAASASRVPMESFSAALVKRLKGQGRSASALVFSPAFVTGGGFELFFGGRAGAELPNMPVAAMGDRILLARINVNSLKPGTTVAGLFSADIGVAFRVLAARDGGVEDGFELQGVGAGTSESGATAAALDRILAQLGEHGY